MAKERRLAAYQRLGHTASDAIAVHGIAFAVSSPPAWVSGFLPIGDEIDPLPLMQRLQAAGSGLCLPVMEAKACPLVFRAWSPGEPLAEVQWGIREPLPDAPRVEPDVVLGPLLAFDALGYRLGYGGGFYDRTLERLRALKQVIAIGLAFDEQRVDDVPHESYDQRLDWVLTPSGPIRCSGD